MPKRFIIPAKIFVHQTEPTAIAQTLSQAPADVNTISNGYARETLITRHLPLESYDKVIVKIAGGYCVPIQAWSYAQIIANKRSLSDTYLRFAYEEDQPDNLILMYPEMTSLPGIVFEDRTLITANNLVPGERYIIKSAEVAGEFGTRGAEFVGKFEDDPSNRLLFIVGNCFFQVPDSAVFSSVEQKYKSALTGPKRAALLTAIRAWADKEWEGDVQSSSLKYKQHNIMELFEEDSTVSELATLLLYYREVNSAIAKPRPTGYPLTLKIVRNREITIELKSASTTYTRDLPQFEAFGKNVQKWRDFFHELYRMTAGSEDRIDWSTGIYSMSSLINRSSLFINSIRLP